MICLIKNRKETGKQASCTDSCKKPVMGLKNALSGTWISRISIDFTVNISDTFSLCTKNRTFFISCHIYLKVKAICYHVPY